MTSYQLGILFALAVAVAWTGSAIAFSAASRRLGSVPVNLWRLVVALGMLTIVCAIHRGRAVPSDVTRFQFTWLAISGVVGFFIGDLTLFRSFVLIGPRRATLLMSLAPAFAATAGWLWLGERLNPLQSLGIFVTLVGVMWVVAERAAEPVATRGSVPNDAPITATSTATRADVQNDHGHVSRYGIFLGIVGALGQGVGAVMTKHAFRDGAVDPFASTQIRAAAAIPLFAIFLILTGRSRETVRALGDARGMLLLTIGAFAGPFLGVSSFNASVARVPSGVTSTLAGMVPVFMLPVAMIVQREHITWRAASGAIVAVVGVAVLTIGGEVRFAPKGLSIPPGNPLWHSPSSPPQSPARFVSGALS